MTKESSKENKPATFKALFLKPLRQWLALNRRSPNSQNHSAPVIQHPNNGLSMTMEDVSTADHRRANNGSDDHFKRTARARMSLPIMQQNEFRRQAYSQLQIRGQQQPRSMGHIYLQYKGETKQANLPNELTAVDTIRALFVCAFPHMLSMEYMSQAHVKIYIYNPSCNLFYELRNIEDVRHESVLRIHQSDPMIAFPTPLPIAHHYSMRLLPPIPQQPQRQNQPPPQLLSLPQKHQQSQQQQQQMQQQTLRRTPIQQQQQHLQSSHQVSPHLQLPPPKPRRMIPVMNVMNGGSNGFNGVNGMNASLNTSMNTSMNGMNGGIYGHNGNMNGLQSANHHMSSSNLIYMAAPPIRRTSPSPWLPPSQI